MFHAPSATFPIINAADTILTAIDRVGAKVASIVTYDNATALSFRVSVVAGHIGRAVFCAVYFVGCFAYYFGQAIGEGHYNVRIAAAEIAAAAMRTL
jgi:hypothetical protein